MVARKLSVTATKSGNKPRYTTAGTRCVPAVSFFRPGVSHGRA